MGSSSAPAVLHGVPVIDAEEFLSLVSVVGSALNLDFALVCLTLAAAAAGPAAALMQQGCTISWARCNSLSG